MSYKMAAVKIYKGAMVGFADETTVGVPDTGFVTNLATGSTNAMIFVGVAEETVDNSGGSAGAKAIKVRREGRFVFSKASAGQADVGREFYASTNQDLTTTTTKNAKAGRCTALVDSGHLEIDIANYT